MNGDIYLSHLDGIAALQVELLLSWRSDRSPGLSGLLVLGPDTEGYTAIPRVRGVMDDFGTFVVTAVEP